MSERNFETIHQIQEEMNRGNPEKVFHAGETRETRIPGREEKRGLVFRFERGQILEAYTVIRKQIRQARERGEDPTRTKEFLKEFRGRAHTYEKDLDELNRQYHDGGVSFEVETPEIGKHQTALVELDLMKNQAGEEDERIPYFVIGGINTNYHQTAALSLALALEGHRVFAMTYPEQKPALPPPDWQQRLERAGSFRPHAEVVRETIKKMGFKRVNIVGFSMGGTVAVETASDQDFSKRINDLVVLEPVGFENKSKLGMAYDFLYRQGALRSMPDAEQRLKVVNQGAETTHIKADIFLTNATILCKKQFDKEKLSHVQPRGRYEVWLGAESPVADARKTEEELLRAEHVRRIQNPDASPVEIYRVEGGDHAFPMVHAMGLANSIDKPKPIEQVTRLTTKDLENSAAASILKNPQES